MTFKTLKPLKPQPFWNDQKHFSDFFYKIFISPVLVVGCWLWQGLLHCQVNFKKITLKRQHTLWLSMWGLGTGMRQKGVTCGTIREQIELIGYRATNWLVEGEWFCSPSPRGYFTVWRHFWLLQLGEWALLLATSGERLGILPKIVQCTERF